jgi:hypothetical protein
MNFRGQFCRSSCPNQMHIAERELSAFIRAVTQLYGSDAAKLAAEDWLAESELMDSPPLLITRNWRAVTIAATARLAVRLTAQQRRDSDAALMQRFDASSGLGSRQGGLKSASLPGSALKLCVGFEPLK